MGFIMRLQSLKEAGRPDLTAKLFIRVYWRPREFEESMVDIIVVHFSSITWPIITKSKFAIGNHNHNVIMLYAKCSWAHPQMWWCRRMKNKWDSNIKKHHNCSKGKPLYSSESPIVTHHIRGKVTILFQMCPFYPAHAVLRVVSIVSITAWGYS